MTFAKLPPLSKTLTKCCACHEKQDALALTRFQRLRLSRKTRKQPPILWLGSAKTSISCETSSTFHTLKERIVSQCVCTAQWREINDAATTTRRRHDQHDQHDANTGPTPDPNYKREPFATHPGKSGIQTTHLQITWWPCPFLMPSCSNWLIQNLQGCFRGCFELVFFKDILAFPFNKKRTACAP